MHSRNLLLTTASLFCCEQCSQMLKSCRPSQRFSCLLCASNSHCSQVCTISVLLGHIASVVGVSVCLLVTTMSCVKSAELINTIWDVDSSGPKGLYWVGAWMFPEEGVILGPSPGPLWSIGNIRCEPKLFGTWPQRCRSSLSVLQQLVINCINNYHINYL